MLTIYTPEHGKRETMTQCLLTYPLQIQIQVLIKITFCSSSYKTKKGVTNQRRRLSVVIGSDSSRLNCVTTMEGDLEPTLTFSPRWCLIRWWWCATFFLIRFHFSPTRGLHSLYSLLLPHWLSLNSKKECPLRLSLSLLFHLFSILVCARIEPHPGFELRPFLKLWQQRVNCFGAILCTVFNLWCYSCCAGIRFTTDYQRLAQWSCLTCSTTVSTLVLNREPESLYMERTRSNFHLRTSYTSSSPPSNPSRLPRRPLLQQELPLR